MQQSSNRTIMKNSSIIMLSSSLAAAVAFLLLAPISTSHAFVTTTRAFSSSPSSSSASWRKRAIVDIDMATTSTLSTSSTTAVFYKNEKADPTASETLITTLVTPLTPSPTAAAPASATTTTTPVVQPVIQTSPNSKRKPTIYPISSLNELQDFLLEDDDRLTAIKFFAPWCKSCRRLGMHYHKLALDYGDTVVDRHARPGQVRFAAVEYTDLTARFIQEQLQIPAVPTLQLYFGTTKVWQSTGTEKTVAIKRELQDWLATPRESWPARLESVPDDGILEQAMEDAFFDNDVEYY